MYNQVTAPVEGRDGKTCFRPFLPVGVMFPQRDGAKSAFTLKLEFPDRVTELVLFEPKDAPDDPE